MIIDSFPTLGANYRSRSSLSERVFGNAVCPERAGFNSRWHRHRKAIQPNADPEGVADRIWPFQGRLVFRRPMSVGCTHGYW